MVQTTDPSSLPARAEENAVYVALMLAGLNDNFELDDFDSRKQGILNALVSCAPSKAAPCVLLAACA